MRQTAVAPCEAQPIRRPPKGPAGGYFTFTVTQLLLPWWLYATGAPLGSAGERLQLLDVRVWFALREMQQRRCFTGERRAPVYQLRELVRLVGEGRGASRTRASLKRLREVGLVLWDGKLLELAVSPDQLRAQDLSGFWQTLELVTNNRRQVPVPRRIARFIAGGASRAEIATILGHLLRCCYVRRGGVDSTGNCTAGWIEGVFGVHATRVKQARARLIRCGLFIEHVMPQWHRNRYGNRIEVNLAWSRMTAPAAVGEGGGGQGEDTWGTTSGTQARPPGAGFHNTSATPIGNNSLPTEGQNQNPEVATPKTPTGVSQGSERESAQAPTLAHIVPEDLADTGRLLTLHAQAVSKGLAPGGERGELEFLALAEHARAYATANAPGMLAWLVRNYERTAKRFVTQDDEEAARRRRLRAVGTGTPPAKAASRNDDGGGGWGPTRVGDLLAPWLAGLAMPANDHSEHTIAAQVGGRRTAAGSETRLQAQVDGKR